MKKSIRVTRRNFKKIDYDNVVVFVYTAGGGMGQGGQIEFSTIDGTIYDMNYLYGDVTLDMFEEVFSAAPCFESPDEHKDWHAIYMGMGNCLFIHKRLFKVFKKDIENIKTDSDIGDLYHSVLGSTALNKNSKKIRSAPGIDTNKCV
ncbi:MAG: hypothetical protein J1G06_08420 [Oscillospiraceae bacterium]|nr:hypothetical protein [Oscillospiraceae bacterium]